MPGLVLATFLAAASWNASNVFAGAGDWKLLGKPDRTGFVLCNLAIDPRETTDLSAHEPERLERMKRALIAYDIEVLKEGPDWWKRDGSAKNMPGN